MVMLKGEIWWATLPPPRGSEPAKQRPVLIIQGDTFNRLSIQTVICAVITSNLNLGSVPPNIVLEKVASGLDRTSVINFSQITTVDRSFLIRQVSMVSKKTLLSINESIKRILDVV
jgi:mRNA interferase MazF